jgi:bifunctional non-homologous end joining protein LigD
VVWDSGTYEPHKFRSDEVIVTFHGERLKGKYALFQTDGNQWMIHRMDPPQMPSVCPRLHDRPCSSPSDNIPKDQHYGMR